MPCLGSQLSPPHERARAHARSRGSTARARDSTARARSRGLPPPCPSFCPLFSLVVSSPTRSYRVLHRITHASFIATLGPRSVDRQLQSRGSGPCRLLGLRDFCTTAFVSPGVLKELAPHSIQSVEIDARFTGVQALASLRAKHARLVRLLLRASTAVRGAKQHNMARLPKRAAAAAAVLLAAFALQLAAAQNPVSW